MLNDVFGETAVFEKFIENQINPQSPDLNPIENLCSILDMKVKDIGPKNENQLFEVLQVACLAKFGA